MPLPQPEAVEMLVTAALTAMQEASANTTADEMLSACFSIALNATRVAVRNNAPIEPLREIISKIYSELPPIQETLQ